jgi:hypothetical protein
MFDSEQTYLPSAAPKLSWRHALPNLLNYLLSDTLFLLFAATGNSFVQHNLPRGVLTKLSMVVGFRFRPNHNGSICQPGVLFHLSTTSPSIMTHVNGVIAYANINHTLSAPLLGPQNAGCKVPPYVSPRLQYPNDSPFTILLLLCSHNPVFAHGGHLNVKVEGTRRYQFKPCEDGERGGGLEGKGFEGSTTSIVRIPPSAGG